MPQQNTTLQLIIRKCVCLLKNITILTNDKPKQTNEQTYRKKRKILPL